MSATIYQASDLSTTKRREFLEDAARDVARLRDTAGRSLVMLRESRLEHIAAIYDYGVAYLALDTALARQRESRRASDFGAWSFLEVFEDEDLHEFKDEINNAISRAVGSQDVRHVEEVLEAWRRSASTLEDPVARDILESDGMDDFFEVELARQAE